jgi:uncharacterized damage-inducible protein DinB
MDDLRYPIGPFRFNPPATADTRLADVASIADAPGRLRQAVAGLDERQLDTPYRPTGWTVRQVVHHIVDSHINAYVRFRLALTEDHPTVRPYDEKGWAELADARAAPVEISLDLLDRLHERWVRLLRSLPEEAMARTVHHPENGVMSLDHLLQSYSWHGRHHVAHITALRARENW